MRVMKFLVLVGLILVVSGTAGAMEPPIMPGDSFEVRVTPPRAGSFMYHTHINDIRQQSHGLYGPLIVLDSAATWNPDTDRVFIAGGFGNYLDREKAIAIGLIPDLPVEKIRFVGNTSILGADLGLLSEDAWQELHATAEAVTYYDLINYPNYYDEFLAARFIPHTDLSRFKSVKHSQEVEACI
jgi:uncharacterized 2Fe-2S/4Fe-4S cluster protein (DUF4445 family)